MSLSRWWCSATNCFFTTSLINGAATLSINGPARAPAKGAVNGKKTSYLPIT